MWMNKVNSEYWRKDKNKTKTNKFLKKLPPLSIFAKKLRFNKNFNEKAIKHCACGFIFL